MRRSSLILLLTSYACGADEAPAPTATAADTPKTVVKKEAVSDEAPSEAKKTAEFAYLPVGKRDPFRSYLAEIATTQDVDARRIEATERFELDQYRLTGLVTGTSQPKALVEDPEGVGHTLRIGSHVGKNGGVISRINADGFIVTEEFRAPTGELVKVPITVKLPRSLQVSLDAAPQGKARGSKKNDYIESRDDYLKSFGNKARKESARPFR